MSIIMRNQNGMRRAHFITTDEAEKLEKAGKAYRHKGYDIWEETEPNEYETKVMEPVKAKRKKASDDDNDK